MVYLPTFAIFYHQKQPNVGKYTSPMDGMGLGGWFIFRRTTLVLGLQTVVCGLTHPNKNCQLEPEKGPNWKRKNIHELPTFGFLGFLFIFGQVVSFVTHF